MIQMKMTYENESLLVVIKEIGRLYQTAPGIENDIVFLSGNKDTEGVACA